MEKPNTIQELAKHIFEAFKGRHNATWRPSMGTVHNLYKMANGDEDDCIFFDNSGHMPFALWIGTDTVEAMVDNIKPYRLYAYRLNGEEHITRIPLVNHGYMHWIPEEKWAEISSPQGTG